MCILDGFRVYFEKRGTEEELPLFKFRTSEENLIFPLGDDGGKKRKKNKRK